MGCCLKYIGEPHVITERANMLSSSRGNIEIGVIIHAVDCKTRGGIVRAYAMRVR